MPRLHSFFKPGPHAADMEPKPERVREQPTPDPQKTALFAGMISFLFPGLGHLLIGARLRGAIWLFGWVLLSARGGGLVVLLLMVIAGIDGFAYAGEMTRETKETNDEHDNG